MYGIHVGLFIALVSLILSAVALIESVGQLNPAWGTVPEWLAATGSLFAFGALVVAVSEWRSGQQERRDREADQARLIIVEPIIPTAEGSDSMLWVHEDEPMDRLRVKNHSAAPVFNLQIESFSEGDHDVIVWEKAPSRSTPLQLPWLYPVLSPDGETREVLIAGAYPGRTRIETVEFIFTDAAGRQWRRVGNRAPIRLQRQ